MRLTNAKNMRDADGHAIHVLGVPSTLLMTNAAKQLATAAGELMGVKKSALIFCGSGNNGGDGIGAACHLLRRGVSVRCFLVGERAKMSPDCAEMARRLAELGGRLEDFQPEDTRLVKLTEESGVLIDAIFGLGLNAPLTGKALAAVKLMNGSKTPVVSADIPSGVEADTGKIFGDAVSAAVTVTFSMAKPGHFVEPGCTYTGRLQVADIGIPAEALAKAGIPVQAVGVEELSLPQRPRISHKGDYGRLLIVGGSRAYTGAPVICAKAAARSGTGLISLGVPEAIFSLTAGRLLEPMPFSLANDENGRLSAQALPVLLERLEKSQVCVLGCGLDRSEELNGLVRTALASATKQLVIDADGLYALGDDPGIVRLAQKPPVLTPHEGEFLRLGGTLTGNRIEDARSFARSRECILVLKGHRSICAFPDGEIFIIRGGNPGMAKGGSGDMLAGVIGAFLCQLPVKQAVVTACAVHAQAGELCAQRLGEYAMLPGDMIETLPEILKAMMR